MGIMKQIDIEIQNSPALNYIWHEMEKMIKRIDELESNKICGQCSAEVPRNEWHMIYPNKGEGVCETCWQSDYVPYLPKVRE